MGVASSCCDADLPLPTLALSHRLTAIKLGMDSF